MTDSQRPLGSVGWPVAITETICSQGQTVIQTKASPGEVHQGTESPCNPGMSWSRGVFGDNVQACVSGCVSLQAGAPLLLWQESCLNANSYLLNVNQGFRWLLPVTGVIALNALRRRNVTDILEGCPRKTWNYFYRRWTQLLILSVPYTTRYRHGIPIQTHNTIRRHSVSCKQKQRQMFDERR